jgi:nicotinate-nucleotide--dimethylbenzimidazole phosphoribosyltransferase
MTESDRSCGGDPLGRFRPRLLRRDLADAARARQRILTKPEGSLGRLEEVAVLLAAASDDARPSARPAAAILFASDHPVAARGVSAYPASVTGAMVANFLAGGAASSVAAAHLSLPLEIVDVGVEAAYDAAVAREGVRLVRDEVRGAKVGDLAVEDALPGETLERAVAAGRRAVGRLAKETRVVVLGEMGIGNTTAAAAVVAALLGVDPDAAVGRGTGIGAAALERKRGVVRRAVARLPAGAPPDRVLAAVGGRDIAALAGAIGAATERGMVALLDGYVVGAAALALVRACPDALARLVFAHRSNEPGHALVLAALEATPLLDLELRLGEASGAFAALPLLDLACALHGGMATFDEARVPGREAAT